MKHRSRLPVAAVMVSLAAASLLSAPSSASAQVQISTRAMELELSGRLQFELQTTSCTDATPDPASACGAEAPGFDMFLRRARLSLEATIDERLSLKIEPDFSDIEEVSLKDAWGRYAFGSGLAVKAGHFKRPFDGFHLTSSSHLPFERAVEVPGISTARLPSYSGLTKASGLSDRDIGFQLEGTPGAGPVALWLGAFTGGSDSSAGDTNAEKQLVGRVQVSVDAGDVPLELAGAVAFSDAPYQTVDGETEADYYTNFELWAERGSWDRDGLLVQAGLVGGDNPRLDELGGAYDPLAGDDFASLLTWQGVLAWRLPVSGADWLEAVTPLVRISYGDPSDLENDEVLAFTPGLALYFHGRNRLALTWDVATFAADETDVEHSLTAQMQFHF